MSSEAKLNVDDKTRKKVALKPGYSLMNWVRLCNSGKDLAGTNGAFLDVSSDTLAAHNKLTDAWMAINGIVYNVTEYMPFHPGGEDELMRGVGIDATQLFNKVHPWVNYESLLKSCVVGRLRLSLSLPTSPSLAIPTGEQRTTSSMYQKRVNSPTYLSSVFNNSLVVSESNATKSCLKIDWYQQLCSLCLVLYYKYSSSDTTKPIRVFANLVNERKLLVTIHDVKQEFTLQDTVLWPCRIRIQTFAKVELHLKKTEPSLWPLYGSKRQLFDSTVPPAYCKMRIVDNVKITQDTVLLSVQYVDNMLHYVHVGHHVYIKRHANGVEMRRPYTPVPLLTKDSLNQPLVASSIILHFIIKTYGDGSFSKSLCDTPIETVIDMSSPTGLFDTAQIRNKKYIMLLAAGTGITPMLSVITWTLSNTTSNVKLILFNKTENDIIWKENLDTLAIRYNRFVVNHVLSEASETWNGLRGLVSEELLHSLFVLKELEDVFVCICGPQIFNTSCARVLQKMEIDEDNYFCFS